MNQVFSAAVRDAASDLIGALGSAREGGRAVLGDRDAWAWASKDSTRSTAAARGLGDQLQFTEALKLLEHLTHEPGLVGIAARFAKTRLHLLIW